MIINLPTPSVMIVQGDSTVAEWRKTLEVRQPGFQFTNAFKRGHWDGYVRPGRLTVNGDYYSLVINRGLLNHLRDFLKENEHDPPKFKLGYSVINKPDLNNIDDSVLDILRDYQIETLEKIADNRWGRAALATNAGKGAIIALTAQILKPHKTLILADEVSVFQALEEELTKWTDVSVGLVEGGEKKIPDEDVVLGMAPTISRRVTSKKLETRKKWTEWLNTFTALLLDEADKATSKTWTNILFKAKNTEFRVGFSGSFPDKNTVDDIKLEENIGPVLTEIKNIELVERGISAKPTVEVYEYTSDSTLDVKDADLHTVYEHLVIKNEDRNNFVTNLLLPNKQNAIVVKYIEHGHILNELIPDSIFLRGDNSKQERKETLHRFQDGEFQNLIATSILDRGSNLLGIVRCLVFASGSGSDREILQRMGRGLRRGEGKKEILIRDVYDYGHDFLVNASQKRMDVYENEGFDIKFIK